MTAPDSEQADDEVSGLQRPPPQLTPHLMTLWLVAYAITGSHFQADQRVQGLSGHIDSSETSLFKDASPLGVR